MEFDRVFLSTPLSPEVLRNSGLGSVPAAVQGTARYTPQGPVLGPVPLSESQWERLEQEALLPAPPTEWPAWWDIQPGAVMLRAELHASFGGSPQRAASVSSSTPNAFLMVGRNDPTARWDGDLLLVPGNADAVGILSAGNRAVVDHRRRGVPLRVFETQGDDCRYTGEFTVDPERAIDSWTPGTRTVARYHRRVQEAVPLLRLRLVSGIRPLDGSADPFDGAPRLTLGLGAGPRRGGPGAEAPAVPSPRAAPVAASDSGVERIVRHLLNLVESDSRTAALVNRMDEARVLSALLQHAQRQADLDELRAAAEDPGTRELQLQKVLERMTWVFGGEFLPGIGRRNLTTRDQLDLTLLRPDGTMHGVELKRACVPELIVPNHKHLSPGAPVHEAVGQAMNYLRSLDEARPSILADLEIDTRRTSMTVVIGHSKLPGGDFRPEQVAETMRTYSSHLSRITVTTYDQLIDNAQRMLSVPELGLGAPTP
ncbi:Shedu anti-phage system protein SduA domain-containing protein [Kitasatospora cineracea]|uniref:Shedu anti-phage system protein SduA domain-containing protein n=1 Tax=Kitasatospora cineracea TaxID=88074 RepID=UPI00378EFE25